MGIPNIHTGIIYRNPKAHVFSRQAYFPSVVVSDDGGMLASFAIGEAFEAADSDVYISRSKDLGESWSAPARLIKHKDNELCSRYARIAHVADGTVVANIVRSHRGGHPEEGLANPENIGFVPTDLMIAWSKDFGDTWSDPVIIETPLIGPAFEMCSPIVELTDGRWLWPTSTWRGWDGYCPNGMKMVALISHDQGKTWPDYMDVMDRSSDNIIFWESKIIELSTGMLLAVAWAYSERDGANMPNQYAVSRDGGRTWTPPASTRIMGETMAIAELRDGRIVSVYRRMDKAGLWMSLVHMDGDQWVNDKEIALWGVNETRLTDKSDNMVTDFNELKFGAPCIINLPDETIFVAFWCYEKMVSNIRWFKVRL